MKGLFKLLTLYLVAHLVLVAAAVGEGFFLHWLLPAIDIATAVLVGLVATIASVYFFLQIFHLASGIALGGMLEGPEGDEDEEDEDEAEEAEEADFEEPPPFFDVPPRSGPRRRRRKKRR